MIDKESGTVKAVFTKHRIPEAGEDASKAIRFRILHEVEAKIQVKTDRKRRNQAESGDMFEGLFFHQLFTINECIKGYKGLKIDLYLT